MNCGFLSLTIFYFVVLLDEEVEIIDSDSEDDSPTVLVAGRPYPIEQINDNLIAQMTPQEKDTYIQVYQDHFSNIYD